MSLRRTHWLVLVGILALGSTGCVYVGRASEDTAGGNPDAGSLLPSLSGDGRYVAFESFASDITANGRCGEKHDLGTVPGVVVRDMLEGSTVCASVAYTGENSTGRDASISDDGRFVAFRSQAGDLVPNDSTVNSTFDIFVRDMVTNTTERVNPDANGGDADANSSPPVISGDGRFVAFVSDAKRPGPERRPAAK